MIFADSHTHLYSEEFDKDLDDVIGRASQRGVRYLLIPNTDSGNYHRMMEVASRFPGICYPMAGLHPTSVKTGFRKELGEVVQQLNESHEKFCAIGEIGIDLYWDKTYVQEQRFVFEFQLDLAVEYDLPVVIHTRNSMEETLKIIRERNNPAIRGVFHCFSGNIDQADQAVGMGFYLGIGGVVTYKNSGLQAVVAHTDLKWLVLETDAPYLPPVPYRGQRNEPSYIPVIAQKVAEIKGLPVEEIASKTTGNTLKLFNIAPEAD